MESEGTRLQKLIDAHLDAAHALLDYRDTFFEYDASLREWVHR